MSNQASVSPQAPITPASPKSPIKEFLVKYASIAAAVCAAFSLLRTIARFVIAGSLSDNTHFVLLLMASGLFAAALFAKNADLLFAGAALQALISVWQVTVILDQVAYAYYEFFGSIIWRFILSTYLSPLFYDLGYITLLAAAIAALLPRDSSYKAVVKKAWILPAAIGFLGFLFACVADAAGYTVLLMGWLSQVLDLAFLLFASYCAAGAPAADTATAPTYTPTAEEGYCGMAKHILLMLFTFGIWLLVWIYRTTRFLNCVKDEEQRDPASKLLLCMFVPFYQVYWTYKSAQRIDKLAAQKGISSDITTLCLVLEFLVPIVPPILMQDKVNAIVTAKAAPAAAYAAPRQTYTAANAPAAPTMNEGDAIVALRGYKDLLDSGVISQEEFDAKKKQLLGI